MDNKQILEYLGECISPMTVESISDKFRHPQREVQRALDELMVGEKLKRLHQIIQILAEFIIL